MAGMISGWHSFRRWVKKREHLVARIIYDLAKWCRQASVPSIGAIHRPLYILHCGLASGWSEFTRIFWYTPLFQTRLTAPVARLYLYSGMPMVVGPVRITLGEGCRVGGQSDIIGRAAGGEAPQFIVGDNADVGWGASIAVGRRVQLGNNVRLAANVQLIGFPGHPIDAAARARGEADTEDQIGDIVIEDDVWLGSGVRVLGGVRIGRGTIVGAGSIVTKDLPPFVIAAGVPARVMRPLNAPARLIGGATYSVSNDLPARVSNSDVIVP